MKNKELKTYFEEDSGISFEQLKAIAESYLEHNKGTFTSAGKIMASCILRFIELIDT